MRSIKSNVGKDLFFYFWQVVCNKLRKQRLKKKKEKAVATIWKNKTKNCEDIHKKKKGGFNDHNSKEWPKKTGKKKKQQPKKVNQMRAPVLGDNGKCGSLEGKEKTKIGRGIWTKHRKADNRIDVTTTNGEKTKERLWWKKAVTTLERGKKLCGAFLFFFFGFAYFTGTIWQGRRWKGKRSWPENKNRKNKKSSSVYLCVQQLYHHTHKK